jgi:hypothetical protein
MNLGQCNPAEVDVSLLRSLKSRSDEVSTTSRLRGGPGVCPIARGVRRRV